MAWAKAVVAAAAGSGRSVAAAAAAADWRQISAGSSRFGQEVYLGFALAVRAMHLQLKLKRRQWQAAADRRRQRCLGFSLADRATRLWLGLKRQQRRQATADQVAAARWWQIGGRSAAAAAGWGRRCA